MLHDLDKTLEKILIENGKINKREIDISFEQPTGEWSARLNRPTVNCWCFDLRENVKLRSMQPTITRENNTGITKYPEIRIDLTYLITAWARKIEDEHQLLWRALGALKQAHNINPAAGEGDLRYQTREIPLIVGDMSRNAPNLMDLWSVLENQMRLGFLVTATLELDTEIGFEAPLVLEGSIRVGQSDDPPEEIMTALDYEIKYMADEEE